MLLSYSLHIYISCIVLYSNLQSSFYCVLCCLYLEFNMSLYFLKQLRIGYTQKRLHPFFVEDFDFIQKVSIVPI